MHRTSIEERLEELETEKLKLTQELKKTQFEFTGPSFCKTRAGTVVPVVRRTESGPHETYPLSGLADYPETYSLTGEFCRGSIHEEDLVEVLRLLTADELMSWQVTGEAPEYTPPVSVAQFKEGDTVRITRKHQEGEEPHWVEEMDQAVGKVGTVKAANNSWCRVCVGDRHDYLYNPSVLELVEPEEANVPAQTFKKGDKVRIARKGCSDPEGYAWQPAMDDCVGLAGEILEVSRGRYCVQTSDGEEWYYKPEVLEPAMPKVGDKVRITFEGELLRIDDDQTPWNVTRPDGGRLWHHESAKIEVIA